MLNNAIPKRLNNHGKDEEKKRLGAISQALFVTFLWSTSWVFIKIGLKDIPALTFAGLRYSLAFVCLLPFALQPGQRAAIKLLGKDDWLRLALLGLLYYSVTQGALFVGLFFLPAATVGLFLNFTSALVALMGMGTLHEYPTRLQWGGLLLLLVGVALYFYPATFPASQLYGVLVVWLGVFANAVSVLLGRRVNREARLTPLVVTVTSMGIGSLALLAAGALTQPMPPLSLQSWLIIAWLAVVNTAFAFTLWNHTLRTLSAVESSVINSTMLVQIAILTWIFLGEGLAGRQIAGIVLVSVAAVVVQLKSRG